MTFELAYPVAQSWVPYIGEAGFSVNKYTIQSDKVSPTGSMSGWDTDFILVAPEQRVWFQYISSMNKDYSCIGLFDSDKNLGKSKWA